MKQEKRWELIEKAPEEIYKKFEDLPKTVVDLLYARNINTQEEAETFLYPEYSRDVHDPFLFKEMKKSVKRIFKAIEKKEKIAVYGDYDADGVSGATILFSVLTAIGAEKNNIIVYLPHRETDGYGINNKAIEKLKAEGASLLISCDCGISNTPEVAFAKKQKIDVIITDHHSIPDEIPDAYSILHPKLPEETYPDKNLAGGAVAFKLAQGLLHEHKKSGEELSTGNSHEAEEKWLLDMVAIASVADMVPLIGESRTLTKYGLLVLSKTRRIGMQKLLLEAKLMNNDGTLKNEITADTIGYKIAPRINAAGRLVHANVAYKLMITKDPIEAVDLAFTLEQNNKERQKITEKAIKEAEEQIKKEKEEKPVLFVINKKWPSGIVGLIASRLKESYSKPAVAMTERDASIVGSGRSVSHFNFIESIQESSEFFSKFGGHPMAFGFSLKEEELLENMKKALYTKFEEKTKGIDTTPILKIDAEMRLSEINWSLYDELEHFAPFGKGNEKPLFASKGVKLKKLTPLGKDKKHAKLQFEGDNRALKMAIIWNYFTEEYYKKFKEGDEVDIAYDLEVNEWNGNRELRIRVVDMKKHEPRDT